MTRLLLLGASLAAMSTPAFGQSYEIPKESVDDIVVTGQHIGSSDKNALSVPISVLSEDDIKLRGANYVTDLLRALPGIAVSSSGGAGQLTQIRMRGGEANHVLVLIDGVEMSNPSDGAFNFAGLATDDIARIEVLRGEQSALYGSDAIGGVINIITRNGLSGSGEHFTARLGTGSLDTIDGAISARIASELGHLTVSANALKTDGFDISPVGDEKDGHENTNFNLGLGGVEIGALTLSAKYSQNSLTSDFDSFPQFGSSDDVLDIKSQVARLSADYEGEVLDHLISLSRLTTETESFGSLSNTEQDQISWAAKWQSQKHDVTGLIEAEQQSYEIGSSTQASNESQSIALDYTYSATQALSLTASARQDINSLFDDQATWRFGGNYQLSGIDGHFRGSVGTGVKNPTLIELFGFTPGSSFTDTNNESVASFVGNEALKAETSLGFNLGYVHNFKAGGLSIDYFQSELDNEIYTVYGAFDFNTYARLSADTVANRETKSTREGVELEGRWEAADTLSLRGSATWLESREDGTDEQRRPEWTASLSADWQALDSLDLNLTANYTGDQIDTDFGTFQKTTLPAFTLVSANARYKITDNFAASLRGENLLDEEYQEVFGYESAPRTVYLGLSADF